MSDAEYNELEDSYSGSGDGDGGRGRSSNNNGKHHNNDEYSSSDNGRVNVDDDGDSSSSGSSRDDNVSRSGDGEQPTFLVNEDEFSDFDIFDKDDSIFGLDPFARARETIYSKYHQDKWLMKRDQIFFTIGVANVVATSYFFFALPWAFPYFYTAKFPFYLFSRAYLYWHSAYRYFLADFCYSANVAMLVYIWILPNSPYVFTVCYALAHGPLAFAILAFGNILVFHDLNYMTSLFIHLTPPLMMYSIRWHGVSDSAHADFGTCIDEDDDGECDLSYLWLVLIPTAVFIFHQFCYLFLVQILPNRTLKQDRGFLTSYLYLSKQPGLKKIISCCVPLCPGPSSARASKVFMYGVVQVVYTFLTLNLVMLWFWSQYANFAFMVFIALMPTYGGAGWYIGYFSKHYEEKLGTIAASVPKIGEWDKKKSKKKKKGKDDGSGASGKSSSRAGKKSATKKTARNKKAVKPTN